MLKAIVEVSCGGTDLLSSVNVIETKYSLSALILSRSEKIKDILSVCCKGETSDIGFV